MVLYSVIQAAVATLPHSVYMHMGVSVCAASDISRNPSVSTDDKEGLFWLQVNYGNTLHFRFGYTLHGASGGLPAGALMRVENIVTRKIVWHRPR